MRCPASLHDRRILRPVSSSTFMPVTNSAALWSLSVVSNRLFASGTYGSGIARKLTSSMVIAIFGDSADSAGAAAASARSSRLVINLQPQPIQPLAFVHLVLAGRAQLTFKSPRLLRQGPDQALPSRHGARDPREQRIGVSCRRVD